MMVRYDSAAADMAWLLGNVIDLSSVIDTGEFPGVDREIVESVLSAASRIIAGSIAPVNAASDRIGARLEDGRVRVPPGWMEAYRAWCADGWPGLGVPLAYGGQAMPFVVQACVASMLGGADLGFAMIAAAARGAIRVLLAHASDDLIALCVPKLASGEWGATIAMTEAHAGTDVGAIRCRARKLANGRFSVTGTKIFISGGDHDLVPRILHLVLARIEGAAQGVKGLSLFLIPNRQMDASGKGEAPNGVRVRRIEEKMGLHGSATCVLEFDTAEGILLGHENDGLAALFAMMSELRLEAGLSAAGLGAAATTHAVQYAGNRLQGRTVSGSGSVPIAVHPDVRRMLTIMQSLNEAARALVLECACQIDLSRHATDETDRRRAARLADWLLPICKAGVSDDALEVCNLGVQVMGGHGYVRESGAEQFVRDVRVLSLYEGANGIQAIDLVMRKLVRDRGQMQGEFMTVVRDDVAACAAQTSRFAIHAVVVEGLELLRHTSDRIRVAVEENPDHILQGASAYLSLVYRLALAWMWLRMARAAGPGSHKHALAEFYSEYYGPELALHAARALRRLSGAARVGS